MTSSKPATILVVDDNDIDVLCFQRSFLKQGLPNQIRTAGNGREALEILRGENGHAPVEAPYVILLDLNMPRMDGFEFLGEIRNCPALKQSVVFVLTTSDDQGDLAAAYSNQIAGYFAKSRVGDDFEDLIGFLTRYLAVNEFPTPEN